MRQTPLERKLVAAGFTLANFRTTRRFLARRRLTLGYGGYGRARGMFTLGGSRSLGSAGAEYRVFRTPDPADILDRPIALMREFWTD